MKKMTLLAGLLAMGAFLVTATSVRAEVDGAEVYKAQKCYKCHGTEAQGSNENGPQLKGSKFIQETPEADIVQVIKNGRQGKEKKYTDEFKKKMPAFADKLSDEEIAAVIKFLKTM